MRSYDIFYVGDPSELLNKKSSWLWLDTPVHPCDVTLACQHLFSQWCALWVCKKQWLFNRHADPVMNIYFFQIVPVGDMTVWCCVFSSGVSPYHTLCLIPYASYIIITWITLTFDNGNDLSDDIVLGTKKSNVSPQHDAITASFFYAIAMESRDPKGVSGNSTILFNSFFRLWI